MTGSITGHFYSNFFIIYTFNKSMKVSLFNKVLFSHTHRPNIVVDKKLIRGSCVSNPFELYSLKKDGVNQIIDLRCLSVEKIQIIPFFIEKMFCKMLGIKHINIKYNHKLTDIPDMNFFKQINNLIVNNPQKTYIHCRHGKRRTGICVAVFEMFNTKKQKSDILYNLYNIGFKELVTHDKKTPKHINKRLLDIYNNFLKKFYPEEQCINLNI